MQVTLKNKITLYFRRTLLSILSGLLAGTAAAAFLISLEWATQTRNENSWIIWLLPLGGFFIGWVYHHYGHDVSEGHNLILNEIHDPQNIVPLKMTPLILLSTILTHLFGGSAGREGTAVQMGASLSDQLGHFFKIEAAERKILLIAGTGAGFGAAIGTPWAGFIFGMEVISVGRLKLFAWFECFVASFIAYFTAVFLQSPHSHFPTIDKIDFNFKTLAYVLVAGVLFGFTAKIFIFTTHSFEKMWAKLISYPPLKPFFAGMILILLYYIEGSYRFVGLGIPWIQEALTSPGSFADPVLKSLFTALTVGSGFKGGEFIPLVFIGTTLGNALAIILPVSFKLLAAVGFAAVFAGAANTPIACSVMAIELFGWSIAPYAVVGCFVSYYFSGHDGIYRGQRRKTKLWSR